MTPRSAARVADETTRTAHRRPTTTSTVPRATSPVEAAALEYAARGWPVLPLHGMVRGRCTCGRTCDTPGKHPIGALVPRGVHDATCDVVVLRGWFRRWPTANVGIATASLVVIDVDPRAGGNESLERLVQQLGALRDTPTVETGGGGTHYYLRPVPGPLRGSLGPGIDVKHVGGYVVAPPSLHVSGRRYAWAAESAPEEIAVASLPAPWLTRLRRESAPVRTTVPDRACHLPDVADRVRRARAYVARLPIAVSGEGGHAALWRATLAVRGFALEGEDAMAVLAEYSARCLPPWSETEIAHKIADAQRASVPWGWLLDRQEVRRAVA